MSIGLDELKEAAAKLSASERAELALALIQSLDADAEDETEVERAWLAEIERAWLAEVERRAGEVDRGEVEPIPGDEVLAEVRRKLG